MADGGLTARAWVVAFVDRMPKAELQAIIESLPGELKPYPRDGLKTCDAMRAYITLARRYYYQDCELKRQIATLSRGRGDLGGVVRPSTQLPSLCEISAAEINAELRNAPLNSEGQGDG